TEALVFAFAYKWFKKDRALLFIILASVLYTIRWILFAFSTEPWMVLVGQLLHGLTFGIFYLSAIDFVTRLIPETLKSSGHLIYLISIDFFSSLITVCLNSFGYLILYFDLFGVSTNV